jgi:hypothetical protein
VPGREGCAGAWDRRDGVANEWARRGRESMGLKSEAQQACESAR